MKTSIHYFALPLLALALASQPVAAQNWSVPYNRPTPMSLLRNQDQSLYIRPAVPSLPEPVAALPVEPDTAVRRTYVREHVRSVVKLRLNDEGQVKDTIEYQEIDERGRRISQLRREAGWEERRQWSYDAADHCTSLVVHPSFGRKFTTIYTFNPALGRGQPDHAAGVVLVQEAGGHVSDAYGKPLNFGIGRTLKENKGIIAAPKAVHSAVIDVVKEVLGAKTE